MSKGRENLDQLRARNAHEAVKAGLRGRGVQDGDAISGFPAMLVNNGLLPTVSYAISKKGKGGYEEICDALAKHLGDPVFGRKGLDASMVGLRNYLATQDSAELRMCTSEALAFLNYLRRFAKGEGKARNSED